MAKPLTVKEAKSRVNSARIACEQAWRYEGMCAIYRTRERQFNAAVTLLVRAIRREAIEEGGHRE